MINTSFKKLLIAGKKHQLKPYVSFKKQIRYNRTEYYAVCPSYTFAEIRSRPYISFIVVMFTLYVSGRHTSCTETRYAERAGHRLGAHISHPARPPPPPPPPFEICTVVKQYPFSTARITDVSGTSSQFGNAEILYVVISKTMYHVRARRVFHTNVSHTVYVRPRDTKSRGARPEFGMFVCSHLRSYIRYISKSDLFFFQYYPFVDVGEPIVK